MRIFFIPVVLTVSLALFPGCRKSPEPYGNFAGIESGDLVRDVVAVLLSAYPPAKTRLNLIQSTEDMFGLCLVESLRGDGYAVSEYAAPDKTHKSPVDPDSLPGLGFGYILDRVRDGGGLRVTLSIGDETLSRMYQVQGAEGDEQYFPVGFWVRKREGDDHGGQ